MLPIVIADDSVEDALLTERVLGQCKIQNPVILLKSGQACVDHFHGLKPFENRTLPCLLLLDMVMSPMSGLAVLKKLREVPAAAGSVLVMLSGLADIRTIHEGYQLGANTFLVKPLLAEDVMQMLRAVPKLGLNRMTEGYELFLSQASPGTGLSDQSPLLPNLFQ
jgi:CheY-like chemotaxis protein